MFEQKKTAAMEYVSHGVRACRGAGRAQMERDGCALRMEAVRELTRQRRLQAEVERWILLLGFFLKHVPRVPEEEPDAEKCLCEVVGEPLAQVENESASSAGSRRAACKSRTFIFQQSPDRGGPAHLHARSWDSAAGTR